MWEICSRLFLILHCAVALHKHFLYWEMVNKDLQEMFLLDCLFYNFKLWLFGEVKLILFNMKKKKDFVHTPN